jgi:hypothetical protein
LLLAFDTFSGEMVGNLEVGLIGPQSSQIIAREPSGKRNIPSGRPQREKKSLGKGERISADLYLPATPPSAMRRVRQEQLIVLGFR